MKGRCPIFYRIPLSLRLVVTFVLPSILVPPLEASARVIRVPDDYASIQEAIRAATDGDTVSVGPGVYAEVVSITKSLTLERGSIENVIIQGSVYGSAPDITIEGFTIRGGLTGIALSQSDRSVVKDCRIGPITGGWNDPPNQTGQSVIAIRLANCRDCRIENNTILDLTAGSGAPAPPPDFTGPGGNGGIAIGLYLSNVENSRITENTIRSLEAGPGASGSVPWSWTAYGADGGSGGSAYGMRCTATVRSCTFYKNTIDDIRARGGGAGASGYMDGGDGGSAGHGYGIFGKHDFMGCCFSNNLILNVRGGHGGPGTLGRYAGHGGSSGIAAGISCEGSLIQCRVLNNLVCNLWAGSGGDGGQGAPVNGSAGSGGNAYSIQGTGGGNLLANNTLGQCYGGERGFTFSEYQPPDGSAFCIQIAGGSENRYINNVLFTTRRGSLITYRSVKAAGLSVINPATSTANYNCYFDHETDNTSGIAMGPSSFEADPLFDQGFQLAGNSPCIDAGGLVRDVTADIEGSVRPMDSVSEPRGDGSDYDIGAYEFPGDRIIEPRATFTPTIPPTVTPTRTPGPTATPTPTFGGPGVYIVDLPGDVTMELVRIPAGRFMMGGDPYDVGWTFEDELPWHEVMIDYDFYIGKYEVTQAQWLAVMGGWPNEEPTERYGLGDYCAAYNLSWNDCQDFFLVLNSLKPGTFRLPSEAEWEYACRAGTTTRFYFGNSHCEPTGYPIEPGSPCELEDYIGFYVEVGRRPPNPWGLYDLYGNINEWCQDRYNDSYEGAPTDGSAWESGDSSIRCVRQYYYMLDPRDFRSARRGRRSRDFSLDRNGFRVVMEAPAIQSATPYGDVTGDRRLDFQDPFFFSRYWYQLDDESETSFRCNPVVDGQINEADLLWLRQWW